ncbi:AAA-like domain-containing protein [Acaryochloris marina]|uniref:AAA-like domain-containing protein n=1 Tax=Acaryochloris marina TaxID=155978 RepID=UPI0021C2D5A1|nr:AAA-like domain-containing protein [Acaryochloris marina]BDM79420.1 hypothetical protein AM10699_22880 [Acaryochloris marina MBIC10699]
MTVDEALEIIDVALAPQRLNALQELIFKQCWKGLTYQDIAALAGYDNDYIRRVGSQLWLELTDLFAEKVTKSNFRSVLRQQSHNSDTQNTPDTEYCQKSNPIPDFPSGSVPLESPFYIKRNLAEKRSYETVVRPGSLIRIKAPKKWGKTSLLLRIIVYAESQNFNTVRLNFNQADQSILMSLDKLLRWICLNLTNQLQIQSKVDEFWDRDLGSKVSCTNYFRRYILSQLSDPLVIALDDLDRLFEYSQTAQDFLPMLRYWHEEANNFEVWKKLRLIVAHSTEAYIPLNLSQSPFNVGLPIQLQALTVDQVQELADRYACTWTKGKSGRTKISCLCDLCGGHPYLLNLAFYHLFHKDLSLQELIDDAPIPTGLFSSHLSNQLFTLQQHPELARHFKEIVSVEQPISIPYVSAYKLESLGLIRFEKDQVVPMCELYRRYFRNCTSQF